jgi:hypothetical protein
VATAYRCHLEHDEPDFSGDDQHSAFKIFHPPLNDLHSYVALLSHPLRPLRHNPHTIITSRPRQSHRNTTPLLPLFVPLCLVSGHTSGTLLTRSSDLCFHANSGTGGAWVVGAASLVSTNSGTSGVEGFSEDHIQFSPRLKRELAVISHAVLEKQVLIARTHSRPPPPRSSPTTPRPHPDPLDQQVNCVGNVHTPNTQTVARVKKR